MNRTWLLLFLAGSVALPFAMSNSSGLLDSVSQAVGTSPSSSETPEPSKSAWVTNGGHTPAPSLGTHAATPSDRTAAAHQPPAPVVPHTPVSAAALPYQAPRPVRLEEVFRFDVTNAWVLGQWPRVSTRLAELDLQGYRVAMISGTQIWDIAGALTYYFNKEQQVERITFRGTTGDTRPLVGLLCSKHNFVRKLTDDPGLHLYEVVEKGKTISELRIMARSIVHNTDPHSRFQIDLVMNRPKSKR